MGFLNNEGINYLAPAHLVLFDVLWPNVNLVGDWSKLAFSFKDAGTIKSLVRKGLKSEKATY